jgi:hypothetical protein
MINTTDYPPMFPTPGDLNKATPLPLGWVCPRCTAVNAPANATCVSCSAFNVRYGTTTT